MIEIIELAVLTAGREPVTICVVSPRKTDFRPADSFGTWLKYLRQLTHLTQAEAASDAQVSLDAVKRMERGQLVGSAHFLAWLSWLQDASERSTVATSKTRPTDPLEADADTLHVEIQQLPAKLLILGDRIRTAGLAIQAPKGRRSLIIEDAIKPSGRKALMAAAAELSPETPSTSGESRGVGTGNKRRKKRVRR